MSPPIPRVFMLLMLPGAAEPQLHWLGRRREASGFALDAGRII
jgi:hypothetical protein